MLASWHTEGHRAVEGHFGERPPVRHLITTAHNARRQRHDSGKSNGRETAQGHSMLLCKAPVSCPVPGPSYHYLLNVQVHADSEMSPAILSRSPWKFASPLILVQLWHTSCNV